MNNPCPANPVPSHPLLYLSVRCLNYPYQANTVPSQPDGGDALFVWDGDRCDKNLHFLVAPVIFHAHQ